MKYSLIIISILFCLSGCYVYKPLELGENEKPQTTKEQLKKGKYYKIISQDKTYKVQVAKWEKDSVVTYLNFKEKNTKKFHQKDISEVQHRSFARGRSDVLTLGAYGILGLGIYFLLQ